MKKLIGMWLMVATLSCSAMEESDLPEQQVIVDGTDILIKAADNNQPIGVAALAPQKCTEHHDVFDLNEAFTKNYNTALMHAAMITSKPEIIRLFVQNGACVNQANQVNGWTPLHYACHQGHPEVIAELIKQGACVNAVNKDGCPPLFTIPFGLENAIDKIQAFLKANQVRKEQR